MRYLLIHPLHKCRKISVRWNRAKKHFSFLYSTHAAFYPKLLHMKYVMMRIVHKVLIHSIDISFWMHMSIINKHHISISLKFAYINYFDMYNRQKLSWIFIEEKWKKKSFQQSCIVCIFCWRREFWLRAVMYSLVHCSRTYRNGENYNLTDSLLIQVENSHILLLYANLVYCRMFVWMWRRFCMLRKYCCQWNIVKDINYVKT